MRNFRRDPQFQPNLKRRLHTATVNAAAVGRDASKSLIQDGGGEVNSEPGNPPMSQSGELKESIDSGFVDEDSRVIRARFGSNKLHSRFLELGTKNMEPRPFLRPAIDKGREGMLAAFQGVLPGRQS